MLPRYIEMRLKKKRKYAYLTMRDFGFDYEEADDPWDMPHSSFDTEVYVVTHRFLLSELPQFESTVKAYYEKSKSDVAWTNLEDAVKQAITYSHAPTKAIEEFFARAGVAVKKVFAKTVDFYELTD